MSSLFVLLFTFFCFVFIRTYKRYNGALKDLVKLDHNHPSVWLRTLLFPDEGETKQVQRLDRLKQKIDWINENLNEPQRDSVKFGMESQDVALIHGYIFVLLACAK